MAILSRTGFRSSIVSANYWGYDRGAVFADIHVSRASSRHPDMIEKVTENGRRARQLSRMLPSFAARHCCAFPVEHNPNVFARNRDVQIGVFITNHIHMKRLEQAGVVAMVTRLKPG